MRSALSSGWGIGDVVVLKVKGLRFRDVSIFASWDDGRMMDGAVPCMIPDMRGSGNSSSLKPMHVGLPTHKCAWVVILFFFLASQPNMWHLLGLYVMLNRPCQYFFVYMCWADIWSIWAVGGQKIKDLLGLSIWGVKNWAAKISKEIMG